jgi:hypothetical protein
VKDLNASLPGWPTGDVAQAVETSSRERLLRKRGRLGVAPGYLVLSSDKLHRRIDALSHFLAGLIQAIARRLILEIDLRRAGSGHARAAPTLISID